MLQRTTISFFGRTNAGKSSLVNALTNQNMSIVSEIKGTTTDPVKKVMELLPIGPITIIDTPGFDDESELGSKRIEKTLEILNQTQIAVLVCDAKEKNPLDEKEKILIEKFKEKEIPYIIIFNKCDSLDSVIQQAPIENSICVSAKKAINIDELKKRIAELGSTLKMRPLISDLVKPGEVVVLVIPIDESAPKDRLILPQQMVLRELLETKTVPICSQVENLESVLKTISKKASLVITDSQAFEKVSKIVPDNIPLTSFSIIMARFKGSLEYSLKCVKSLDRLGDGDKILISEGCTHHRQCKDIGTVKMPSWIQKYTDKKIEFKFCSPVSAALHPGPTGRRAAPPGSRGSIAAAPPGPLAPLGGVGWPWLLSLRRFRDFAHSLYPHTCTTSPTVSTPTRWCVCCN